MHVTTLPQLLVVPVIVLLCGVVWGAIAGVLWERDRNRQEN